MELCVSNNLFLSKTIFENKDIYKSAWISTKGGTKNAIGYICVSRKWRSSVRNVRVYRGAEIHSDHDQVKTEIRVKLEERSKNNKE